MKKMNVFALALAAALALSLTACGSKDTSSSQSGSNASSSSSASGSTSSGSASSSSAQSGPFTEMKTVDLEGNEVDSSIFANNKLTLVNAWNLGCTPCVQEIPHLDKLNDDLAEQGVAVVGLYYNFGEELTQEDRADIAKLYEETGADYTQLLTSEDMMASDELKTLSVFPTTFFVDSQGNIVETKAGSNDYEGWKAKIDEVLTKVEADG